METKLLKETKLLHNNIWTQNFWGPIYFFNSFWLHGYNIIIFKMMKMKDFLRNDIGAKQYMLDKCGLAIFQWIR